MHVLPSDPAALFPDVGCSVHAEPRGRWETEAPSPEPHWVPGRRPGTPAVSRTPTRDSSKDGARGHRAGEPG